MKHLRSFNSPRPARPVGADALRYRCLLKPRLVIIGAVKGGEAPSTGRSLSDMFTFESDLTGNEEVSKQRAEAIIAQASRLLDETHQLVQASPLPPPSSGTNGAPPSLTFRSSSPSGSGGNRISSLTFSSDGAGATTVSKPPSNGGGAASSSGAGGGGASGGLHSDDSKPDWAKALFSDRPSSPSGGGGGGGGSITAAPPPPPMMARQAASQKQQLQQYAEPEVQLVEPLLLRSQEEDDITAARAKELPPLQSIMELTRAHLPPTRGEGIEGEAMVDAVQGSTAAGRAMQDGVGVLPDGTRFEKLSGEEWGEHGYCKTWTLLRGKSADGKVDWEECWWEASDASGYREMGAVKRGQNQNLGSKWDETWSERVYYDQDTLEQKIERTAHKRASDGSGDEWEEKWGEFYGAWGRVNKYADKWAKQGCNVWHEKWGEDYDNHGASKYTDKWAERLDEAGGPDDAPLERWGDKWTENFHLDGTGSKHGQVWSEGQHGGNRYNKWWNEEHYGNGDVRLWGDSSSGENYDETRHFDMPNFNPVAHYRFEHAIRHSPDLLNLKVKRRPLKEVEGEDINSVMLEGGIDAL